MKKIFQIELANSLSCSDRFDCVRFKQEVVNFLIQKWEDSPLIQKMNGRAFHKYIYPNFVEEELLKLNFLRSERGKKRCLRLLLKKIGKTAKMGNSTLIAKIDYEDDGGKEL